MNETNGNISSVEVSSKNKVSAIWIVPIIALLFGGFLVVKAYMDKGINIIVHLETADGIEPGKTEVKYKGLTAGVVQNVTLDEGLSSVSVEIEMVRRTKALLTKDAQFWVVRPEVSLSGVSGLETLTSGNYIGFKPGLEPSGLVKEFDAIPSAPPIPASTPGKHITLHASTKGSIQTGTKIYYRQIAVGQVTSISLDKLKDGVIFKAHIEEKYQDLITNRSRFWNASGLSFTGGLDGFKVRTESFESLMVGGIAFDNVEDLLVGHGMKEKKNFALYEDFEAAQVGLPIVFNIPFGAGIKSGTELIFEGMRFGKILDFKFDLHGRTILANATVDPRAEPFLNDQTIFYMVAPKASLSGVSNLDTLVRGRYIGVRPSKEGVASKVFDVLSEAPILDYSEPGLHITLTSDNSAGLTVGDPVLYRNKQVGSIQQVKLIAKERDFELSIHIKEEFAHLVSSSTRFWNSGGIKVKGGLQRFEVQTGSLLTMLSGGITFDHVDSSKTKLDAVHKVENGTYFKLYEDQEDALFSDIIRITFPSGEGVVPDVTPVVFNGVTVGEVKDIEVSKDLKNVVASVGIDPKFNWTLKEKTQFWLVSSSVSEGNFDAVLGGAYITLVPGSGKPSMIYLAQVNAPIFDASKPGLQFVIETERAGSLKRGSGIFYQNMKVGEVQGVQLNRARGGVDVFAHIGPEYEELVKTNSRFYQVSGISVKGDISGFKLHAESLSSMLNGGVAFYTPKDASPLKKAKDNAKFVLYEDIDVALQAGVEIEISFNSADGLRVNMPIRYQDQKVGEVTDIKFNEGLDGVVVEAVLRGEAMAHAREDSRLWLVEPEVGLTNIKNVETLVTGTYLAISPGLGEPTYRFKGLDYVPAETRKRTGLNIRLVAPNLSSIKIGDSISYRQIKIGEVIGIDLASDSKGVQIFANISERFAPLIKNNSVFWNTSGLNINAGLFSGVNIETESVESLLSGGISMATPEQSAGQKDAEDGQTYTLFKNKKDKWQNWSPAIELEVEDI